MRTVGAAVAGDVKVYEAALAGGAGRLITERGHATELPVSLWSGPIQDADSALLDRCSGPTLDAGCGPGRMTAGLVERGIPALGIDISALAVRMTASRGGLALQRNIFHEVPGKGRWNHVLLADGNIGIGGNPIRLLRRCRELLAPRGTVLLDLENPGAGMLVEKVRIQHGDQASDWFRWCWLGVDAVAGVAAAAGLSVTDLWCANGRWQAELAAVETLPTTCVRQQVRG